MLLFEIRSFSLLRLISRITNVNINYVVLISVKFINVSIIISFGLCSQIYKKLFIGDIAIGVLVLS